MWKCISVIKCRDLWIKFDSPYNTEMLKHHTLVYFLDNKLLLDSNNRTSNKRMLLPCCYILKSRQLQAAKNEDEKPIIRPQYPSLSSSSPNHSHCILCKYQVRFLHSEKMRLIFNSIITGSLLVFLLISCTTALFWHPRNICEQSPAPSCEAGEYLQSQFIASTNESEIMNCSPYSTFERKLWFDCVVSSFILEFKNFSD